MEELIEDLESVFREFGYNGALGFLSCKCKYRTKEFTEKEKKEIDDKMLEFAIKSINPRFLESKNIIRIHLQHVSVCDYLEAVKDVIDKYSIIHLEQQDTGSPKEELKPLDIAELLDTVIINGKTYMVLR